MNGALDFDRRHIWHPNTSMIDPDTSMIEPVPAYHAVSAEGVRIRPFNDLIFLMPPVVIDSDDLHRLTSVIDRTLAAV